MTDPGADALADWSLLQAVTERLNAAESMDATLRAMQSAAPAADEAEVCLWTVDHAADATPEWLTLVGILPAVGQPARGPVGMRHHLPAIKGAGLYLADPGVPFLVSSVDDDPRLDPVARDIWRSVGVRATILMTLTLRGRNIGMLTLQWGRELALGPREQRMFQALSRHAALLLDNFVMVERLHASLAATRQHQKLLETVIDHVPAGILCIEASTRRPMLTNRTARMQLSGRPDPVSEPLPMAHMLLPGTDTPIAESELAGMRAGRTGVTHRVDLDLVTPGNPRISVETIGVPVFDQAGKVERVVVVMTDITGRKQAAEERARLQEAVIRAQAAALAERSTPLIPISDDVLIMPLIGSIDRERGESILETALTGARERRARVAILDITGVPTIDVEAVAAISNTARALRLLGVTAVLTGVRPQVAQTMIDLDASLAGIVACGSLQAGVAYALRRRSSAHHL